MIYCTLTAKHCVCASSTPLNISGASMTSKHFIYSDTTRKLLYFVTDETEDIQSNQLFAICPSAQNTEMTGPFLPFSCFP